MFGRTKLITKIIVFALVVYAGISLFNLWGRTEDVRRELHEIRKAVAEMEFENAKLEHDIDNYDDPGVKEGIAKAYLGLVQPGEIIFSDAINGQSNGD